MQKNSEPDEINQISLGNTNILQDPVPLVHFGIEIDTDLEHQQDYDKLSKPSSRRYHVHNESSNTNGDGESISLCYKTIEILEEECNSLNYIKLPTMNSYCSSQILTKYKILRISTLSLNIVPENKSVDNINIKQIFPDKSSDLFEPIKKVLEIPELPFSMNFKTTIFANQKMNGI